MAWRTMLYNLSVILTKETDVTVDEQLHVRQTDKIYYMLFVFASSS